MSECTTYLKDFCNVGGACVRNNVTLEETCVCDVGFGPDDSFFHNVYRDCSLPYQAYLGWLMFQTLGNSVVFYRLIKQFNSSKGRVRRVNFVYALVLVFSWMFVCGIWLQHGMYEVTSIALALIMVTITLAAFGIASLFIEARYAIDMQSAERALQIADVGKYILCVLGLVAGITQAALSRSVSFNYVVFANLGVILLLDVVLSSLIMFHNIKLAQTVKALINKSSSPAIAGDLVDEKPALLKRLKVLRNVVIIANVFIASPVVVLLCWFVYYSVFPLQWVITLFAMQFFPLVGLQLNNLNELIQSFKLEKIRKKAAASPTMYTTSPVVNRHELMISSPFFKNRRTLSKLHRLIKYDTVLGRILGVEKTERFIAVSYTKPAVMMTMVFTPALMVMASIYLFKMDSVPDSALIGCGVTVLFFIAVIVLGSVVPGNIIRSFYQSVSFQLRFILTVSGVVSASSTVELGTRSLVCSIFNVAAMLFFINDWYRRDKVEYRSLVFMFATAIPFYFWFILAFDLLDGRRNGVYSAPNGNFTWSTYHFAMNIHLFIVWCVLLDVVRLIRNSLDNYLFFSCPLNVRIVTIADEDQVNGIQEGVALREFEVDFDSNPPPNHVGRRVSKQQQLPPSSPTPRRPTLVMSTSTVYGGETQPVAAQSTAPAFVRSIVIREKDCLLAWLIGDERCQSVLRAYEHNPRAISLVSGLGTGLPLALWSTLVLTRRVSAGFSILFMLITMGVVLFRASLKSTKIVTHLLQRVEFFYEFIVFCLAIVTLGVSLNKTDLLAVVPGILALCAAFLDWRTDDALVNPRQASFFRPLYFLCVVAGLICLPIMVYSGSLPGVNQSSLVLVKPLVQWDPAVDAFAFTNPPKSTLSRQKFSQLVFDAILVFVLKLVLDMIQRTLIWWHNPDTIVLDYLRCTVAPDTVDEEQARSLQEKHGMNDPFWDPVSQESIEVDLPSSLLIDLDNTYLESNKQLSIYPEESATVFPVDDNEETNK